MTVHQVSEMTGVTVRALQYYDRIGLLPPAGCTEAGYRLYDEASLERLQQIMLLRELAFPLRQIRMILDSPDYDRKKALAQQAELLELKKERLEKLIALARGIETGGVKLDFKAFDTKKIDEYAAKARETWGHTDAYKEFEEKTEGRSKTEEQAYGAGLMELFKEFGTLRNCEPSSAEVQAQVKKLQEYITAHYYRCTDEILAGLGQMYTADEAFRENIDRAGGEGTAAFAGRAIVCHCRRK